MMLNQIQQVISIHSLVKRETLKAKTIGKMLDISIHSLVKRETLGANKKNGMFFISIHSLVKRETGLEVFVPILPEFQSTPS